MPTPTVPPTTESPEYPMTSPSFSVPNTPACTEEFYSALPPFHRHAYEVFLANRSFPQKVQRSALSSFVSSSLKHPTPEIVKTMTDLLFSACAQYAASTSPSASLIPPADEIAPSSASPMTQEELQSSRPPYIILSSYDYQHFVELISSTPDVPPHAAALLLSMVVFYRRNHHRSGWVRYDRRNIFFLASVSSLSDRRRRTILQYIQSNFELLFRVIGSTSSITCYQLPWLEEQPLPGTEANPLINFGPLSPEGLQKMLEKVPKEILPL